MTAVQAASSDFALSIELRERGLTITDGVFSETECEDFAQRIAAVEMSRAGGRSLLDFAWCRSVAVVLRQRLAVQLPEIGSTVAVQCIYFRKSTTTNWLVPWHQDRSVPVAGRVESDGLSGWSQKEGVHFVYAPDDLLAEMLAVRLHLDDSTMDNGPLRVVAGSHREGTLSPEEIAYVRARHQEISCVVCRGGVLAMRPLLLHASSKCTSEQPRRVLQFLFGPPDLPLGLAGRWAV